MKKQNARLLVLASLGVTAATAAACGSHSSPAPKVDCDAGDVFCMAFDSGAEASTSSSGSGSGGGSGSSGSSGGSEAGGSSGGDSGNEAGPSDGGPEDGGEGGTMTVAEAEAGPEGPCADGGFGPGNPGGPITVYNFSDGCTVSLNYAAATVSSSYQACVAIGNQTAIVIGPASPLFELGPSPLVRISSVEAPDASNLIFSTGDGGFGSTSTHVVGISAAPPSSPACALVCCPFADGTGCDSSQSGYTAFLSNCP